MRRGSTPFVTLSVDGEEFKNSTVVVTIDQDGTQITKSSTGNDVKLTKVYDEETGEFLRTDVTVYLSQADTLKFDVGQARAQVRWVDILGYAWVTDIVTVSLEEVLLEREIEYGETD